MCSYGKYISNYYEDPSWSSRLLYNIYHPHHILVTMPLSTTLSAFQQIRFVHKEFCDTWCGSSQTLLPSTHRQIHPWSCEVLKNFWKRSKILKCYTYVKKIRAMDLLLIYNIYTFYIRQIHSWSCHILKRCKKRKQDFEI